MSKIGVFDSGIGGVTVLKELVKVLPKLHYSYYSDSANNPYGDKTDEEICIISDKIVESFIKDGCKAVVIACNTASAKAAKYLREKYPNIVITELLNNYGILNLPESLIDTIVSEDIITYMEKPKQLFFEITEGKRASCITTLQSHLPQLSGRGTLVGIIDSGIDYAHPDFITTSGSSRILALWDQTIPTNSVPNPFNPEAFLSAPTGYSLGTLFSKEIIDASLSMNTVQEQLKICPSRDISGHGTHVTGIAAGNGRASNGVYRGVAYEADLIIVKLGTPGPNSFPSTSLLMMGIDFCIRESINRNQPLALNLSFGNTYGSHSGNSLLETYLDSVSELGRISIVVGSGNEGSSGGHVGGILQPNQTDSIQFSISDYTTNLNIQLWKNYWDEFTVTLKADAK